MINLSSITHDFWYGFRCLVRRPRFAVIVTIVLSVGMGATTAIFSVVNAALFERLPYPDPERLAVLSLTNPRLQQQEGFVSYPTYEEWKTQSSAFEQMTAYLLSDATMTGIDDPQLIQTAQVEPGFFSMLGVRPLLGRTLAGDEESPGGNAVVVLSYSAWIRRFGGNADVLSQTFLLDGARYAIVGVMPPGFAFPSREIDLWRPLLLSPEMKAARGAFWANVAGRLRVGVPVSTARAQIRSITSTMGRRFPEMKGLDADVKLLRDHLAGDVRPALLVLMAAVGCVLLIACANVAMLMLAHMDGRARELAVRVAMGASRARLIRQLFAEMLPLPIVGGAVGLLLQQWLTRVLLALAAPELQRFEQVSMDNRLLVFAFVLTAATTILFGTIPALRASRTDPVEVLREDSPGVASGRSGRRTRSILVVTVCALAVMLLSSAGLLMRTLWNLRHQNPGFTTMHVLTATARISPVSYGQPGQVAAITSEILNRIRTVPGVTAAEATRLILLNEYENLTKVTIEEGAAAGEQVQATVEPASPGYFTAIGVPLRRGRWFNSSDRLDSERVVLVNETMARTVWPDQDPIGKRFVMGRTGPNARWMTVVGIIGDMRRHGLDQSSRCDVFVPLAQMPSFGLTLIVRSTGDPMSLAPAVRRAVWSVAKDMPLWDIKTLDDLVTESFALRRFQAFLLACFALIALLLADVGVYGLVERNVTIRTREMGVRMALGAQRKDIIHMILREGMLLTIMGIAIGIGGALALTRLLRSMLFEIEPTDPATFLGVAIFLTIAALAACYIPARRAVKVDPMVALRHE